VHAAAFVVKDIDQSTTWPGANNTLTVIFATNIALTSGTKVYMSGFFGANSARHILPLPHSSKPVCKDGNDSSDDSSDEGQGGGRDREG
jgi:hypothetical protein